MGIIMNWKFLLAFLVQGLFFSVHHVSGYKTGAPTEVCDTMIPGHGLDPQTSQSPYKVTLSRKSLKALDTLFITLTSENAIDQFKGFLIQVREADGDTAVGRFTEGSTNTKTIDCFEEKNSAVTHDSNTGKQSVTVQWSPPDGADGDYQVYYTAARDGSTYWTKVAAAGGKIKVHEDADEDIEDEDNEDNEDNEEGEDEEEEDAKKKRKDKN